MSNTYLRHTSKRKTKLGERPNRTTVKPIPFNKLFSCSGYTILDLMLDSDFSQFLEDPNDTNSFKNNLINFLQSKFSFFIETREQDRLDGISSLIKSIRNDIPISSSSLGLIKQLIKETDKDTETTSIEK